MLNDVTGQVALGALLLVSAVGAWILLDRSHRRRAALRSMRAPSQWPITARELAGPDEQKSGSGCARSLQATTSCSRFRRCAHHAYYPRSKQGLAQAPERRLLHVHGMRRGRNRERLRGRRGGATGLTGTEPKRLARAFPLGAVNS